MKKEDISSLIIYLLMIAIAVIVGFTAISDAFKNLYNIAFNNFAFAIIVIIVGLLVNVVGLEIFHVLGAHIGGYKVVSFNILGFCWTKKDNKWKFAFSDFDGLTGETKICPKEDGKKNLKPFIWLPLLAYIVELVLCVVIYSLGSSMNDNPKSALCWLAIAALLFVVISSMIALYNFVPLKLDSMTDGYRLVLLSNKTNIEALNEMMRVENLQREGKTDIKIKVFDEITEYTASINLYSVYENLAKKDYNTALTLIDNILNHSEKISQQTVYRLIAQKLYIKILTLEKQEAEQYYNKEVNDSVRRFISNDLSMESLRAYVLIAGLLDESKGEVGYANSRKEKALKTSLKSRAIIEEKLYNDAIELVKKAHPDWEI